MTHPVQMGRGKLTNRGKRFFVADFLCALFNSASLYLLTMAVMTMPGTFCECSLSGHPELCRIWCAQTSVYGARMKDCGEAEHQ